MRIWNGLNVSDKVKYKNKEYIVKELYQKNDMRFCKLVSIDELENILENVPVGECQKLL